jgi:hypothetical protein
MVRHEQPAHDLALHDVPLHDLGHIGFRADPVPDTFRIDHDTGAHLAMVEAAGLVRAHESFEIQPFRFALEMSVEFLRSQVRATATWIVLGALVDADENMTLKRWHGAIALGRHGGRIEPPHQKPDVIACKQRRLSLRGIQNGHDFPQPHGRAAQLVTLGEF